MGGVLKRVSRILRGRWLGAAGSLPHGPGSEGARPFDRGTRFDTEERRRALAVLELGPDAGATEVRAAYRALCRRYHPDYFAGDEERARDANELLAEINRAYEELTEAR